MASECIRRGGVTDVARLPRFAVGPACGWPFWKLKKCLTNHHLDTDPLFSPEERILIKQKIVDLRDWSVAAGAAISAVGESQSPQDGGGGREEAANDGMMRRAA